MHRQGDGSHLALLVSSPAGELLVRLESQPQVTNDAVVVHCKRLQV